MSADRVEVRLRWDGEIFWFGFGGTFTEQLHESHLPLDRPVDVVIELDLFIADGVQAQAFMDAEDATIDLLEERGAQIIGLRCEDSARLAAERAATMQAIQREKLVADAAEAQEIFGDDELERYAEELRATEHAVAMSLLGRSTC